MIELPREKYYSNKDSRFKTGKSNLYDLTKAAKFTSSTISNNTSNSNMNNGNKINKQDNKLELPKITTEKNKNFSNNSNNTVSTSSFLYVGMSNGNIFEINLSFSKNIINSYGTDLSILKCDENFKHKGAITCLFWENIDGTSMLFSGSADCSIKVWNLEVDTKSRNHYVKTLLGHTATVLSIGFSKSRSVLCSSSADSSIRVWKLDDNFDKILNPLFQCVKVIKVRF